METVLLTWWTWFVGSFLLEELVKKYKVILLKRSFSNTDKVSEALSWSNVLAYDIDKIQLKEVFESNHIDAVIHTATSYGRKWETPSEIIESAMLLPMKLLELSLEHGINTFINTDSYFNQSIKLDNPELWFHAEAKRTYLAFAKKLILNKAIKFLNMKIGHVYWPRDDKNKFVPSVIYKLLANDESMDFTLGEQERNFVYVRDLVNIYVAILEHKDDFENGYGDFEGRTWEKVTVRQLVEKVKQYTGSTTMLNFGALPYREWEIMTIPDKEEKLDKIWWKPQYTIDQWLEETIAYFKSIQ